MEKQQFKAESQRLLDLMINSIYTNREIFLREIISNASDAIDKLAYTALTDDKVGISRDQFAITITRDEANRTLTVSDNGIGMSRSELEENLGTIAKSGSLGFKQAMEKVEDIDIIGQRGIGQFVHGIGCIGNDLPQEDLPVGIDGIDHQVQQSLGLCFELLLFHSVLSSFHF